MAGYYASRMGLPIDRLIVATNANDILDRFFKTGRYEKLKMNGEWRSMVVVMRGDFYQAQFRLRPLPQPLSPIICRQTSQ